MSEIEISTTPPQTPESKILSWWPKTSKTEKYLRHVVAILAWAYLGLNIFVTDVDATLVSTLPMSLAVVVKYKFFFFVGGAAIALALTSTSRIVAWSIYVLFYPITRLLVGVLYIAIIIFYFKSWPLFFSVLNVILSFINSFKVNFIIFAVLLVCSTVVIRSHSPTSILSAVAILALTAVTMVARRFVLLFRPSQLLKTYTVMMAVFMNWTRKQLVPDNSGKALQPAAMDKKQLDKWTSNLQNAIILNESCEFLIRKFADYRKSGLPILYYLLNYTILLAAIVLIFTIINIGIYRADPNSFTFANGHSAFDFFYYVFSSLVNHGIPDMTPVSVIARSAWIVEALFAAVLIGMFAAIYFAHKKTLDDAGIGQVIETLRGQAASMQAFVKSEFSLSLEGAIDELERLEKSVSGILKLLRAASSPD